jgi:hypothetical protein
MMDLSINPTNRADKHSLRVGIDHLWVLIPLSALAFLVSILPVPPNDLWWHLKIGQLIFSSGSIPSTNLFAWSLPPNAPFTYGAWMGEYLLYLVYHLGRLPLLIFTNTLLLVLAFAFVSYEARRRSGSWRLAGVVLILAAGMSFNNAALRPQIWAFLPFIAFLVLLGAYADRQAGPRWLLILPLVMVVWVNVHGTFILGFVLLSIFLLGEVARKLLKFQGAHSWSVVAWLAGVILLCLLAILINPQGVHIFSYVYNLMTDQPSQALVMEWQTPVPNTPPMIVFYASILLVLITWAFSSRKPSPTDLLLVLAFTWLAWSGVRYVIWYAMVVMPISAGVLKDLLGERTWLAPPLPNLLNLVLALVLFLPVLLVQPWWISRLPLPEKYTQQVLLDTSEGPLLSTHTPVGAVEYLRENPGGFLFNEMGYGSYLIWALPEQGVFIDPRVELYPYEQWLDYIRITRGVRYNELLDEYGADRLLLDVKLQDELISILEGDPTWRREYADPYSQVWTKVK